MRNQIDFGDDPKTVFDVAQQEVIIPLAPTSSYDPCERELLLTHYWLVGAQAIATLKLLVYRTYMKERHHMKYNSELPPVDDSFVLSESPL